jgi:hypothetical protein
MIAAIACLAIVGAIDFRLLFAGAPPLQCAMSGFAASVLASWWIAAWRVERGR